ncbi:MAG: tetratricopeptide repeat protein, partial [Prevotella sp.]|nr:tetratricopeptide repeat protein [Prevotella sp.]
RQLLPDPRKLRIFAEIYSRHTDTDVRQYALIAFLLTRPDATEENLYDDEITKAVDSMETNPDYGRDIEGIQRQLLLAADTKDTQRTINNEILPVLREGAERVGADDNKTESQLIDGIIHPEREEKEEERMEASLDRMRQMREQGADVFFAGFSQAKRFSFFYTLMNWFVPFSIDHPQVASLATGDIPLDTLARIMETQNFCDSDKYSFVLTFSRIAGQLPKQMIDMLRHGEAESGVEAGERGNITFRRSLYLQDLYRFYTLHPMKRDFTDPFSSEKTLVFITWEKIYKSFDGADFVFYIAGQLLERGYFDTFDSAMSLIDGETHPVFLKLKALGEERRGRHTEALEYFRRAAVFEPDNPVLLREMARLAEETDDCDAAKRLRRRVLELRADEDDTAGDELYYALCCLRTGDTKSCLNTLYKLNYLHKDDVRCACALAWGLTLEGRRDEAKKLYEPLSTAEMDYDSVFRKALVLWMTRDKGLAVDTLRTYAKAGNLQPAAVGEALARQNEACRLALSGADIGIITDLAFDETK